MGHYTGQALRLCFKPDTPPVLLEALRDVMCLKKVIGDTYEANTINVFTQLFGMPVDATVAVLSHATTVATEASVYFHWHTRRLELVDDQWVLYVKGDNSDVYHQSIRFFLLALREHLVLTEGQVVYRSVYEQGRAESVFYIKDGDFAFGSGLGYHYNTDHGDVNDSNHPTSKHYDPQWDPPYDFAELQALNVKNKAERDASKSGYGF